MNNVLPREAVSKILGHLPTINERFYDYDISSLELKTEALEKMSGEVINFSTYKQDDPVRKAR